MVTTENQHFLVSYSFLQTKNVCNFEFFVSLQKLHLKHSSNVFFNYEMIFL